MRLNAIAKNIPDRGGIFRVRVKLHYTWLFALVIVTFNLTTQLTQFYPIWIQLGLGVGAILVFLLMLVIRQFGINLIAISRGIPLRVVTLYVLGGVPGIPRTHTSPLVEILLGVSGFLFSLLVILAVYMIYLIFVISNLALAGGLVFWLITFMILFMVLNIVPGFPMDGGRILRALIWRANNNYDRSTRITSRIAQLAGLAIIILGIWMVVVGRPWFEDGTIILSGWIILVAGTHSFRISNLRRYLTDTKISEVIIYRDIPQVRSEISISSLVHDYVLASGHHLFIVMDENNLSHLITLNAISKIPKRRWHSRTVGSLIKSAKGIYYVTFEQSAADVLEQMIEMDLSQMPVIKDDQVVGVVDREELLRLSLLRKDLRFLTSNTRS